MTSLQKGNRTRLMIRWLIMLQFFDGILTYFAIAEHNHGELNPLLDTIMQHVGLVPGIIIGKGLAVLACIWLLKFCVETLKKNVVLYYSTLLVLAAYICVVLYSISILL